MGLRSLGVPKKARFRSADGRPAQAADVTLTQRATRPIELRSNKRRLGAWDLDRVDDIASRVIFRAHTCM